VLPAPVRMRRGAEFTFAVRRGSRGTSGAVTVHLAADGVVSEPASATSTPRVGFVVSRAVGPAVVRNRVRRRLRHLLSSRLTALPAGAVVVVRAHPAAAGLTSALLGADLDQALRLARQGRAR
jgi:ribonuclease P protein component